MTGHTRATATPEILRVDQVSVTLAGRQVLDQVSFAIGAGEFTGLIGPNGAGKTTLLRVILGLQRPTGGQVCVLGRPRSPRHQPIGYVPQKVLLDPDMPMRVRDLVALGLDGNRFGVRLPSRGRGEAVRAMLHAVDADRFADARVGNLSGGEQQRVLIAQALVRNPELLLLDEPLDSLDLASQGSVAALVQRICREQGVAVMLVAHDVNPILPYLDRVIYLAAGGAACGAAQEVITSATLTRLYEAPVEVLRSSDGRLVVVGQPEPPFVHGHRHDH
jgi:zinc/manganese transport system ATP-binding protein